MNSLLLIIGVPKDLQENPRIDAQNRLMMLCQKLASTKARYQSIEYFPPNIWLIGAENGLSFLRNALDQAGDEKLPCRLLPLAEPPNWIQGVPEA